MGTRERLQEAFKFALAMTLTYWLALAMNWDLPQYAGLAVVVVSLDTAGASLKKGLARLVGTVAGVPAAWVLISVFSQDRFAFMVAMSAYLVFCAYFVQRSKVPYAWLLAVFVALSTWSHSYGDPGKAFHFGIFRFLETTTGVAIVMIVWSTLWPRTGGMQLVAKGEQYWSAAGTVFTEARGLLTATGSGAIESPAEAKLAGALPGVTGAIGAAAADTRSVRAQHAAWQGVPAHLQRLSTALELVRLAAADVCATGARERATAIEPLMEHLERRLASLAGAWAPAVRAEASPGESADPRDGLPALDAAHFEGTSILGRLSLRGLVSRAQELDSAMSEVEAVLTTLRNGATSGPAPAAARPLWESATFVRALMPAVTFCLAFVLWIGTDVPTGASVPQIAGVFGILMLTLPNLRVLHVVLKAVLQGLVCLVPVYFFIMPWLGGGPGILVVIFVFSAFSAWLGAANPAIRLGAMLIFTNVAGISNAQTYSFVGFVDAALMFMLAFGCVFIVYGLFSPMQPGRDFTRSARQFFETCARLLDGGPDATAAALAQPLAGARTAHNFLDPSAVPANTPERVNGLLEAMQTLSLRLQALEHERTRWRRNQLAADDAATAPLVRAAAGLQSGLDELARHEAGAPLDDVDDALGESERAFAASSLHDGDTDAVSDGYSFLGSSRGVLAATKRARAAVADLDWERWADARF